MHQSNHSSPAAFPAGGRWTREQLMLAFAFYCQTSFGRLHNRNPDIIALAKLINRTPSALAMKLGNFASLDPLITGTGRTGLGGASALDREVWDAFHADWDSLALECDRLRRELQEASGSSNSSRSIADDAAELEDYSGETRQAITRQRVKQDFFRRAVLASYGGRCCLSGVSEARLLIASHIVAWRDDKANRLNPANGLCLSAIHDRAFDQHLFTLDDDLRVVLGASLKRTKDAFLRDVFGSIDGKSIEMPQRFAPNLDLLAKHRALTL